jgi:hypothetical protein
VKYIIPNVSHKRERTFLNSQNAINFEIDKEYAEAQEFKFSLIQ